MQGNSWGWSKPNLQPAHPQPVSTRTAKDVPIDLNAVATPLPSRGGAGVGSLFRLDRKYPTLPTLTLIISELQTRYPTLEVALTPTLENLSTNYWEQLLIFQFTKELVRYSLSNFR